MLQPKNKAGSQLVNCLYNLCVSSQMRNTDKFVLDYFFLVRPGTLWLPLGVRGAPIGRPLGSLWPSWSPALTWASLSEQICLKYRACTQDLASRSLPAGPRKRCQEPLLRPHIHTRRGPG